MSGHYARKVVKRASLEAKITIGEKTWRAPEGDAARVLIDYLECGHALLTPLGTPRARDCVDCAFAADVEGLRKDRGRM